MQPSCDVYILKRLLIEEKKYSRKQATSLCVCVADTKDAIKGDSESDSILYLKVPDAVHKCLLSA